ncbi:hypothetical protein [Naasia sp. SYSU D00948]|uniref:hypothetical protein n=1 Tax=Naasia sp. SYSU D00948 TaxID=2817379 RepID=UPI001B307312|nr:hypothetical protein [Naasia sp. SYSU D00948]
MAVQGGDPLGAPAPADAAAELAIARARRAARRSVERGVGRILPLAALLFVVIEIAGNLDRFTDVDLVVGAPDVTTSPRLDVTFDLLTGWDLTAGITAADATVIVTALLVFAATFGVAFIATFLVPTEATDLDYLRVDWAQTVQQLVAAATALAAAVTATRVADQPALAVALLLVTIGTFAAYGLLHEGFLGQKLARVRLLHAREDVQAAALAFEAFRGTISETAREPLGVGSAGDPERAPRGQGRCRALILVLLLGALVLETVILWLALLWLVATPPPSAGAWAAIALNLLLVSTITTAIPIAVATFGLAAVWAAFARRDRFLAIRVAGLALIGAGPLALPVLSYGDTEPFTAAIFTVGAIVVVAAAVVAVAVARRTGRGPGTVVLQLAAAKLAASLAAARQLRDRYEAELDRHH